MAEPAKKPPGRPKKDRKYSFDDKHKLSIRSLAEVRDGVAKLLSTFRMKGLRLEGEAVSIEALVNALLLYASSLPPDRQIEMFAKGFLLLRQAVERERTEGIDLATASKDEIERLSATMQGGRIPLDTRTPDAKGHQGRKRG